MTQLELFGSCIMGRRRKSEADRLLDCERRAEALGMRIVVLSADQREELEIDLGDGPYGIDDGYYIWPRGRFGVESLAEELDWFESQEHEDDPEPDPRARKALIRVRRAAA